MDQISIDDFRKIDIRIGKILRAERIPEADKLLKLIFDIGGGEERQILAGIAEIYPDPRPMAAAVFEGLLQRHL